MAPSLDMHAVPNHSAGRMHHYTGTASQLMTLEHMQAGEQELAGRGGVKQCPNPPPACELTSICTMLASVDLEAHAGMHLIHIYLRVLLHR